MAWGYASDLWVRPRELWTQSGSPVEGRAVAMVRSASLISLSVLLVFPWRSGPSVAVAAERRSTSSASTSRGTHRVTQSRPPPPLSNAGGRPTRTSTSTCSSAVRASRSRMPPMRARWASRLGEPHGRDRGQHRVLARARDRGEGALGANGAWSAGVRVTRVRTLELIRLHGTGDYTNGGEVFLPSGPPS